jgi:hypothetical protein
VPTGYKVNPIGIGSYMRLYPGFDGLAANGLRYGATAELRQNFGSGGSPATSPSGNSSAQTVYVRRAFTYLASDKLGLVRLGQGDGVLSLFDNCIFTSQCWDGGLSNVSAGSNQSIAPQAAAGVPFVWLNNSSAEYGNNKIVYLSPQFYGFDFGVQYAPNMGNSFQNSAGAAGCIQASAGCIGLTSGNDPTRWYNQVGAGLRYQQNFGAVDIKAYGFYETAAKEKQTVGTRTARYNVLNFYKAGVAATAMNFTLAADYIGGAINNQLNMKPRGGADMSAVLAGLTYANGPIILGSQFGFIDSQGAATLAGVSQRHEYIMALGGSYRLAPGLQMVAEYQYWQRHQGNYDFANAAVGATRDAKGQSVVFATVLTW